MAPRENVRDFDLPGGTRTGWLEGMIFKGKYELVKRLGRGAQTEAWKAKDLEASDADRGVFVVLKLLPQDISGSIVELLRIKKNFQKVHDLVHQRIASYRAFEQDGDSCLVVMELVPGVTLGQYHLEYAEKHGNFPVSEAVRICRQIAEGLDYARSRQVAHRDVKPDNIMVTPAGDVKILDFGLAAEIRSSLSRVSMQQGTDVSGTNLYKAPEQWRGLPPQFGTDQYALAVVFYELLSEFPPFSSDDPVILRECVLNDLPQALPMLSEAQNRALLKALAKNPAERFANCVEFIDAMADGANKMETAANAGSVSESAVTASHQNSVVMPASTSEDDTKELSTNGMIASWIVLLLFAFFSILFFTRSLTPAITITLCGSVVAVISILSGSSVDHSELNTKKSHEKNIFGKEEKKHEVSEKEFKRWLNAQPIKLGDALVEDFKISDNWYISSGSTLMSIAAAQGKLGIMKQLKLKGEDIKTVNKKKHGTLNPRILERTEDADFPMCCAARGGHIDAMEWLWLNGVDVDIYTNGSPESLTTKAYNSSPMHCAALGGHVETMEWLKSKNAKLNTRNRWGNTPMHSAAQGGHIEAMEWLKTNGLKINDSVLYSPMCIATENGHVEAMKWLRSNGAEINTVVKKNALWALSGKKKLQAGTLMHIAASKGRIKVMEWLKSNGLDINAKFESETPLDLVPKNCPEAMEWLVKNGGRSGKYV